jgi:hypothetical protein
MLYKELIYYFESQNKFFELLRLIFFIIISPVIGIIFAVLLFFMGIFMLILFIEDLVIQRRYYE